MRVILAVATLLSLAVVCPAGIPDPSLYTIECATSDAVSVFCGLEGETGSLAEAYNTSGQTVDATATATLVFSSGDPIVLYPAEDIWLVNLSGNQFFCGNGLLADRATDINGQTTFTNPIYAGGQGYGYALVVAGAASPCSITNVSMNSPDINGDGVVNLTDVNAFTIALSSYTYAADFNYDGVINLSDYVAMTPALGTSCTQGP